MDTVLEEQVARAAINPFNDVLVTLQSLNSFHVLLLTSIQRLCHYSFVYKSSYCGQAEGNSCDFEEKVEPLVHVSETIGPEEGSLAHADDMAPTVEAKSLAPKESMALSTVVGASIIDSLASSPFAIVV